MSLSLMTMRTNGTCAILRVRIAEALRFRPNEIVARSYHRENGKVYGCRVKQLVHYEGVPKEDVEIRSRYCNFYRLVAAYRSLAHQQADINPIAIEKPSPLSELQISNFGLRMTDKVRFRGILGIDQDEGTVQQALDFLNTVYSSGIGVEFDYLKTEEKEWFAQTTEKCLTEPLEDAIRITAAKDMLKSQSFDNFLAVKFVSFKRYGAEGAESMMVFFRELFKLSAADSLKEIVLGMAHRGRLSLLTGMLNFPPEKLFRKLRGFSEFGKGSNATGDVPTHLISLTNLDIGGNTLHITLLRNPSHLEAVNPISMGATRGIMQLAKEGAYGNDSEARWSDKILNLQVHGDAAYIGQGVCQECLSLSAVPHFEVGGTIHLMINNQLGFTTPPSRGRSSRYCTDLAKMIDAPVIHVNGNDPEMVIRATRIAFKYQRKFRKDVFVDLNCYRRWGHNELDDPTFTNPIVYKIIQNQPTLPDLYAKKLIESNILTEAEKKNITEQHFTWLSNALKKSDDYIPETNYFSDQWVTMKQADSSVTYWDTGVNTDLLKFIAEKSVNVEKNSMDVHPQLMKNHVKVRLRKINNDERLDWSCAEAMAIGSLLYEGYNVRISGEDVGRGTFSHRHVTFVDQSNEDLHIPLNFIAKGQTGKLEVANSILSEEAVLGYEYGMSITNPSSLYIWEAQFGDFFNGAQIIIDTFISSGEAKWMLSSGLTMLLPHGYDGAGPEHSSCRIERFLQLSDSHENRPDGDDVNMQIVNPTTPSQYFHLLRRQMVRNFRKPLIVVAPKILLRHPTATSSITDMQPGTSFKSIIGDDKVDPMQVDRVILVSGKHYYALDHYRQSTERRDVAIIRLESLCPFPVEDLLREISKYKRAKLFIWSQEEPRNMGAWTFVKTRFENLCGRQLTYCGRSTAAAVSVGDGHLHRHEAEQIVSQPFSQLKSNNWKIATVVG